MKLEDLFLARAKLNLFYFCINSFFGSILLLALGVQYLAQIRGLLGLVELLGVFDQIDNILDGFQHEQLDLKNAVDNNDESQKNRSDDDGDPVVLLD